MNRVLIPSWLACARLFVTSSSMLAADAALVEKGASLYQLR
jgi:hypothetical protein